MTERLSQLLRDEADDLVVPAPPVDAVLRRGRRVRGRRRLGSGLAVAAALAVVASSAVVLHQTFAPGPSRHPSTEVDPLAAYVAGGAYAVGSTVRFTDSTASVDVHGQVKALYYTSAGVVVRTGKVPWTDSAGASHYALITPDGHLRPLPLSLGDVKPGTSPASPYLAYASRAADGWRVHFLDVRNGVESRPVSVTGAFTWGGWAAPPVALDGDTAYVALDRATVSVTRGSTRSTVVAAMSPAYFPEVAGGHALRRAASGDSDDVVDVATGAVVLAAPTPPAGQDPGSFDVFSALSPDGGFVYRAGYALSRNAPEPTVHDLTTGASAPVRTTTADHGWTPGGDLLWVTRTRIQVCPPITGRCATRAVSLPKGTIRIGGNDNES